MERAGIDDVLERIRQMELRFDALQNAANADPLAIREDALLREHLRILTQYYEGGQWLCDYGFDEKGLIPKDMKRGVLSQDALYDLLERVKELSE